ncbi:hypothetical protein PQR02_09200 [Paraburkholderia sediminicola]|uniref:Uncharacterized protein n=1 Tax=Paraburkholderia rhynchosiae TaxID=487049 RepID=A0ACC7N9H2_9BURK
MRNPAWLRIQLIPSADDGPFFSDGFQASLRAFYQALDAADIQVNSVALNMDVVDARRALIGEFVFSLAQVGPALSAAVGAWLEADPGRKLRLKMFGVEFEVNTMTQLIQVLDKAIALREERMKPAGCDK